MRRRDFITLLGGAAAWPIAAHSQQAMPVVGFVHFGQPSDSGELAARFRRGVVEGGFTEGRDVTISYRWAEGRGDRVPSLIADLVDRNVAAIMASGPAIAQAVKAATAKIPIVFTSGDDPVQLGLVASLNHPGGNATGVYIFASVLEAKRLGLLHEMVPRASLVAVLVNPTRRQATSQVAEVQDAARTLGLKLHVQNATTEGDFEAAFASFAEQRAGALTVLSDPFLFSRREQIVALAAHYALPAVYEWKQFTTAGGLMGYGADIGEGYRQAGSYIARILKGEKPADLPVVQSSKFEFAINLKTAKALGLDVPPMLLARADEVID